MGGGAKLRTQTPHRAVRLVAFQDVVLQRREADDGGAEERENGEDDWVHDYTSILMSLRIHAMPMPSNPSEPAIMTLPSGSPVMVARKSGFTIAM